MLNWAKDSLNLDELKMNKLVMAVKPLQEAGILLQVKYLNPNIFEAIDN